MSVQRRLASELLLADVTWQKRKRKLNTAAIFSTISSAALRKRGLQHIITDEKCNFTAQALGQARDKLPEGLFLKINTAIQKPHQHGNRVFAVDGPKVHG